MSRQKFRAAVGMFIAHTTLSAQMFKFGLTQRQDCQQCGD